MAEQVLVPKNQTIKQQRIHKVIFQSYKIWF